MDRYKQESSFHAAAFLMLAGEAWTHRITCNYDTLSNSGLIGEVREGFSILFL